MNIVIVVNAIKPPIPSRAFDYCAYLTGDTTGLQGWSSFPAGAIRDLVSKIPDNQILNILKENN